MTSGAPVAVVGNGGISGQEGKVTALGISALEGVRAALSDLPAPVVIFNKSHSGSRLLAQLVETSGYFLGNDQNESCDALNVLKLVRYVVERYYPDYTRLWHGEGSRDLVLAALIRDVFHDHLAGFHGQHWGWKLCETTYILPLIDYLFPRARYLHIIRDGRDVAFSNHVAPVHAYWQKVYTDAPQLRRWRGLWYGWLARIGYGLDPLLYNAQHWVNSVTLGCRFGAMLRERYLEVRYEDLCRDFAPQARRVLAFIDAPDVEAAVAAVQPTVHTGPVGKHRRHSRFQVWRVQRYAKPLLIALGYLNAGQ